MFVIGASVTFKCTIVFTHLFEFSPGRESLFAGIIFFIEGTILIIAPLILLYVTKNTQYLLLFSFLANVLCLVVMGIIYIPESTKFLLEKKEFD